MVENAFREAYKFPELDFEYQKDVIKVPAIIEKEN
jgi:hypothetical protein